MAQVKESRLKETKENLLKELASLRRQVASLRKDVIAAETAGSRLAVCFKWDREEYQTNFRLVSAVTKDKTALRWLADAGWSPD